MSEKETQSAGSGTVSGASSEKSERWRKLRDRGTTAALTAFLLGFGLAAGPTGFEPAPPAPPKIFTPAAMMAPAALRDAPVADALKAQSTPRATVQVAASLRRLVPPQPVESSVEAPVSKEPHPAPEVEVTVDISDQRATVVVNGVQTGYYKVSTGLGRHWTPRGTFPPKWLNRHHRSSIYNNAPMPYSVFFNGNIALHGTNQIRKLGRPASKGCVRMHPANARKIFNLIYRHGRDKVQIAVQD